MLKKWIFIDTFRKCDELPGGAALARAYGVVGRVSAAPPGTIARRKSNPVFPHRLHITELMQAKVRQLPAKAALLHAAERHPGIAGAVAVDKHPAALELAGKAIRRCSIGGKHRR